MGNEWKFGGLVVALAAMVSPAGAQTLTLQRDNHPSTSSARGIAVADFNRDGWTDIVTAHNDPDGVAVLLNRGAAGGYTHAFITLQGGPFDLVTGDLNKDGRPDIAVANPDANLINVLFGNGDGTFRTPLNVGARFPTAQPGDCRHRQGQLPRYRLHRVLQPERDDLLRERRWRFSRQAAGIDRTGRRQPAGRRCCRLRPGRVAGSGRRGIDRRRPHDGAPVPEPDGSRCAP